MMKNSCAVYILLSVFAFLLHRAPVAVADKPDLDVNIVCGLNLLKSSGSFVLDGFETSYSLKGCSDPSFPNTRLRLLAPEGSSCRLYPADLVPSDRKPIGSLSTRTMSSPAKLLVYSDPLFFRVSGAPNKIEICSLSFALVDPTSSSVLSGVGVSPLRPVGTPSCKGLELALGKRIYLGSLSSFSLPNTDPVNRYGFGCTVEVNPMGRRVSRTTEALAALLKQEQANPESQE